MTAINQNVIMYAGNYLEIEVPVKTASGNNVNPAGMTAMYKVENVVVKTPGEGLTIDIEDGTMFLLIIFQPKDTINKASRRPYPHEIEIVDNQGRPFTVLKGTLTINSTLIQSINEEEE